MATLITLLDVETEAEYALKTYLAATPYNLAAVTSDGAAELTTPRVEVVAEVVRWGPHQYTPDSGTYSGVAIYDQFLVRTSLSLVYQPEQGQSQGTLRGTLRKALSNWTGIKAAFASHNYLLPTGDTLRQIGGARSIDDEEKTETITSEIELMLFVNPSALAAAT